jgi:RluA family pseudouridine synthase
MTAKDLEILYEDDRLVAVHKPVGVLVVPGRGTDAGKPLAALVQARLKKKPFVVHRLDRETSGVVVFAKDAETHKVLCAQFESRKIGKRYLAVVHGALEIAGTVDKPLRRFGSGRIGIDPRGKNAVTRYRPLEVHDNATLIHAFPETGRQHQIRVHLFSLGHAIVGDPLYHKGPADGAPRMLLHAERLKFVSPGGEPLTVKAEPPADFLAGYDAAKKTS